MTARSATMITASELLALEAVDARRFRSVHNLDNGMGSIFGGQPLAQGLMAAGRTAPGWPTHSLSAHFLRAGAPDAAVDYEVEVTRDGRRFATRRVLASQGGRPIFDMLCAFHDPEDGLQHQFGDGPPAPDPETLQSLHSFLNDNASRLPDWLIQAYRNPFPIELRLIDPESVFFEKATKPERTYWFRLASRAETDAPLDHQALLAFLSDFWFAGTAGMLHSVPGRSQVMAVVTLNHSLWLHAPVKADDWLLYRTDSPWAGDGRGLARGLIYDRAGRLAATAVQEISMRLR